MSQRPRRPEPGVRRARSTVATALRPGLLGSQLTRRPTASSSTSGETLRLDVDVLSDTSEIVVRNQQGEIELGDPPSPAADTHDEQTEDRHETEKERQRLTEAVKRHADSHSTVPDQPEDLLEAVRSDLRAKVNALAEDNWMFEPEEPARG